MRRLLESLVLLAAVSPAAAASFDCAKARTPAEHAVCADPRLSDLDTRLGRAYLQAKRESAVDRGSAARVAAIAKAFFAQRRACGTARACLVGAYAGGIEGYLSQGSTETLPAWVDAATISSGVAPASKGLATQLGRCVATRVDRIGPRLQGDGPPQPSDFDSGTGVSFANGATQVSYSREPAVIASRRGDPVVMCLISIPRHCPPGDDRGRFYLVTNQRTKATWTLPDSEHMCGGA